MAELANKAEHRQVAQDLRRKIKDGTYPVGAALPSYSVIEAEYKVTRDVARRAVDALRTEGLVATTHGIGTEVIALPSDDEAKPPRPRNLGEAMRLVSELLDEVRKDRERYADLDERVSRLESERTAGPASRGSKRPRRSTP